MNKKISLCVVSPLYHPNMGGPGRQSVTFTEKYISRGSSAIVFCRKMKGLPSYDYNPDVKVHRLWSLLPNVHNLEEISFMNLLISLSFSISLMVSFFKRRSEYHIVHFFGAGLPLILSLLLLKVLGKKIATTVLAANLGNEAGSLKTRYFPLGLLMNGILKNVDHIIAMTDEIRESLLRDGFKSEKIRMIPNWVDISKFHPVDIAVKSSLKKKLGINDFLSVLFIGRLVYRKGADLLVRAWKDVVFHNPSSVLLLAGTGTEQNKLKSLLRELGIEKNVLFLGHINNADEYLKAVDIFVLPSRQEGMPTILLDAMACGLSVIATKIGGVVEIIEDGKSGVLVAPDEVSSLADALNRLLKDKETRKRLGEEARKRIAEHFSIDSIMDKYIKLYNEL